MKTILSHILPENAWIKSPLYKLDYGKKDLMTMHYTLQLLSNKPMARRWFFMVRWYKKIQYNFG